MSNKVIDKVKGEDIFISDKYKATEYNGAMYLLNEKDKTARLLYVKKIKYGLFGEKNGVLNIPSTIKAGLKTYTVIGMENAYYRGISGYDEWHKDGRMKGGGYSTRHYYETDKQVSVFGMVSDELKELVFPDTWTDKSVRVEVKNLTAITLPKSITTIPEYAFSNNEKLKYITIPDGVTEIGNNAFSGCHCLEKVIIPNTVKQIGDEAFRGCEKLIDIIIPDGVTEIGKKVFSYCHCLEKVIIPNTVERIGDWAFYKCEKLVNIIIPDGVTEIGKYAFCELKNITSVTIGKNVRTINEFAFFQCKSLETIKLPSSLGFISDDVFSECNSLKEIIFENPQFGVDKLTRKYGSKVKIVGKEGNRENPSMSVEGKPATNTNSSAKTDLKENVTAQGATIDLKKLIQAALADGVVTDKERAILIKKVKEAGGNVDEFEMMLDALIFEAQKKVAAPKATPVPKVESKPKPEINTETKTKLADVGKGLVTLNIAVATTVADLCEQFKSTFGGTLRVYQGNKRPAASENVTSIAAKTGTLKCSGSMTVEAFDKAMLDTFGLKVKVASCDDWVVALDALTLEQVGKIKKNATKADMEKMI